MSRRMLLGGIVDGILNGVTLLLNGRSLTIVLTALGCSPIWKDTNLMKLHTDGDSFKFYMRIPDNCDVSLYGNPSTLAFLEEMLEGMKVDLERKGLDIGVSCEWNSTYKSYAYKLTNIPPDEYIFNLLVFTGTRFTYNLSIK